jgi:hypothetical protein
MQSGTPRALTSYGDSAKHVLLVHELAVSIDGNQNN